MSKFDLKKYLNENKIDLGKYQTTESNKVSKGVSDIRKTNYEVRIKENGKLDLYTHKPVIAERGEVLLRENEDRPLATEVKKKFLEIISTYKGFKEQLSRQSDVVRTAETLGGVVEAAKTLTLSEAGDWFDKVTIKRNMKELDKLDKDFEKVATEARSLDERLNALYDDMGHILGRYYEINEVEPEVMKKRLGIRESKKKVNECGCGSTSKTKITESQLNESERKLFEFGQKIEVLMEKNCPTNPSKWSYYKGQAKKKFDVYPSAYANGWAAKQYKAAGGGWKNC